MAVLRVVPKRAFSWDFRVYDAGREVARIDRSRLRRRATFELDGARYEVRREGLLHGPFLLTQGRWTLARAEKPSVFLRSFHVVAGDRQYTLKAAAPLIRGFVLLHGDRRVGFVTPERWFRRSAKVDFPETLPLAVRIFMAFLVLVLWQRDAAAAAAGA